MYPVLSLILALLLVVGLGDQIKKYPVVFYVVSTILGVGIALYYQMGLSDTLPEWFTDYAIAPFKRGAFSTSLFILVMYAGALNPKWSITKKLYKVRGEISIIACIFTLAHNFIYGKKHFPNLFFHANEMKPQHLIATILTLILIAMMLPLMITSFQVVRKRMSSRTWKKIQKLAYPFFALIYIHVMTLFLPKAGKKWLEILIYTAIFAGYAVLRVTKAYKARKGRIDVQNRIISCS